MNGLGGMLISATLIGEYNASEQQKSQTFDDEAVYTHR